MKWIKPVLLLVVLTVFAYVTFNYVKVKQVDGKTHIDFGRAAGLLEIHANVPDAVMDIDDRPSDALKDGMAEMRLPPGEYVIGVQHPRYGRRRKSVAVADGQTQRVDFRLELFDGFEVREDGKTATRLGYASVVIETDQPGATIALNGRCVPGVVTPIVIDNIQPEAYAIIATAGNNKATSATFALRPGENFVKLFYDKVAEAKYIEEKRLAEEAQRREEQRLEALRLAQERRERERRLVLEREQDRIRQALQREQQQLERQRRIEAQVQSVTEHNTKQINYRNSRSREWVEVCLIEGRNENDKVFRLSISANYDSKSSREGTDKEGLDLKFQATTTFAAEVDGVSKGSLQYDGYHHYGRFRGERTSFIFNAYNHEYTDYERTGTEAGVVTGLIDAYPFLVEIRNKEKDSYNYTVSVRPHPSLQKRIEDAIR